MFIMFIHTNNSCLEPEYCSDSVRHMDIDWSIMYIITMVDKHYAELLWDLSFFDCQFCTVCSAEVSSLASLANYPVIFPLFSKEINVDVMLLCKLHGESLLVNEEYQKNICFYHSAIIYSIVSQSWYPKCLSHGETLEELRWEMRPTWWVVQELAS